MKIQLKADLALVLVAAFWGCLLYTSTGGGEAFFEHAFDFFPLYAQTVRPVGHHYRRYLQPVYGRGLPAAYALSLIHI